MSQMDEFERIAVQHGEDSKRGHLKNYFLVTGRVMDHVAYNSMSGRIGKALRVGGRFAKYAGSLIKPDATGSGRTAEWTVGHEPAANAVEIEFAESPIVARLHALVTQPDMPKYELPSTASAVQMALTRMSRGSHVAQNELANGMTAQEYERRLKAMNEEAAREREVEQKQHIAELAKLVEYFTSGAGAQQAPRGNGRALVTRRRTEDRDEAEIRRLENRKEGDLH